MFKLIVYVSNILESVTNTICNTLCYFGISCHHSTLLHCDYLTICDEFVPSYTSFISVLSSRIVFRARFECLEATSGNALEKKVLSWILFNTSKEVKEVWKFEKCFECSRMNIFIQFCHSWIFIDIQTLRFQLVSNVSLLKSSFQGILNSRIGQIRSNEVVRPWIPGVISKPIKFWLTFYFCLLWSINFTWRLYKVERHCPSVDLWRHLQANQIVNDLLFLSVVVNQVQW